MATSEEFLVGLYLTGGHPPFAARLRARTYLALHGVPPAPLDAASVQFTELGIPIVTTTAAAPSPPATPAEAAAIANASGGLVEAQEVQAYGLSAEEATALSAVRDVGINGSAAPATPHARSPFGGLYVDQSDYLRLRGFGLPDF